MRDHELIHSGHSARGASRPKRNERAFRVLYAIQIVLAVLLFAASAAPIEGDVASSLEVAAFRFFNDWPGWLFPVFWPLMQAGNMVAVPVVGLWLGIKHRWHLVISVLFVGAAKYWLARVVKDEIVRHRPGSFIEDVTLRGAPSGGQAFVSGHATIAIGMAVVLHPYLARTGRIIVWSIAIGACIGRIYVGAHLPLDVLGGGAVGWALGSLVHVIHGPPSTKESFTKPQPSEA